MRIRLLGCDEPRPDAYRVGARGEQLAHSCGGSDPARGNHPDGDDGERLREGLVESLRAANVAARLDALDGHEVATGRHRRLTLRGGTGLPARDGTVGSREADQRRVRIAVE